MVKDKSGRVQKTARKKRNSGMFPKGKSGNPKGRPPTGFSWSEVYKECSDKTYDELMEWVGKDSKLGMMMRDLPPAIQSKYVVVISTLVHCALDPTPGLLKEVADRAEGKVPDRMIAAISAIPATQFDEYLNDIYNKGKK